MYYTCFPAIICWRTDNYGIRSGGVPFYFIVGLKPVTETVKRKAPRNKTYEFHEVKILCFIEYMLEIRPTEGLQILALPLHEWSMNICVFKSVISLLE